MKPTRRARGHYSIVDPLGAPVLHEAIRAWCVILGDGLMTDYEGRSGRASWVGVLDLYGTKGLGIKDLDAKVAHFCEARGWAWERTEGGTTKVG